MSKWQELQMAEKITEILGNDYYSAEDHHLGRAFWTSYQIAIEFLHRYPNDVEALGFPSDSIKTGSRNSLQQYIGRELSRGIKNKTLSHIEGGFLSNTHLNDLSFKNDTEIVSSSLTHTDFTVALFRLKSGEL